MAQKKRKRQQLKQIEKQELLEEKARLIQNIIKINNHSLHEIYLSLQKLIQINRDLFGKPNFPELAERLQCQENWIKYLLRFEYLMNSEWLDKINAKIILFVLGFNEKCREKQDEYFTYFYEHGYTFDKARIYILKEYTELNDEELENKAPHILCRKLATMFQNIWNHINLVSHSTMNKKDKKYLITLFEDLEKKVKEVLDEEKPKHKDSNSL